LAQAQSQFKQARTSVIAISADALDKSRTLAIDRDLPFPLASDPELRVINAYGVAMQGEDIAVPSVFLVAPDGQILWHHVGETMMDRPVPEMILSHARAWAKTRW
jgi:peroxiredoxin